METLRKPVFLKELDDVDGERKFDACCDIRFFCCP